MLENQEIWIINNILQKSMLTMINNLLVFIL